MTGGEGVYCAHDQRQRKVGAREGAWRLGLTRAERVWCVSATETADNTCSHTTLVAIGLDTTLPI